MKRLLIFTLMMGLSIYNVVAQVSKKVLKTETLIEERVYTLNGGARSSVGGKSRTFIMIDLPPNTKSWYYSFTTSSDGSGTKNLNLALQLSSLLFDPSGITATTLKNVEVPPGAGVVDVYLCDRENIDKFQDKDDNWGGTYRYFLEGTVENLKQGLVAIDDVTQGTYYLGLKNPSTWDPVTIKIEVVAIVEEEEVDLSSWSKEMKDDIFQNYRSNLKELLADDVAEDVANCFVSKLTTSYTPEQVYAMSESEKAETFKSLAEKCVEQFQGGPKSEDYDRAISYGKLGWSAYEKGNLESALSFTQKALDKDPSIGWIKGNLGLFQLIQKDIDAAIDTYLDAIELVSKDRITAGKIFEDLIKDINDAKTKYPDLEGYEEILSLLEDEHKKYKVEKERIYTLQEGTANSPSSTGTLSMKEIKIKDGKTIIKFSFTSSKKNIWIAIEPKAHLIDTYTNKRLPLEAVKGITLVPEQTSISNAFETVYFELTFPALSEYATSFKFVETEGSNWNMEVKLQ